MDPVKTYDYLALARQRVLIAARALSREQYWQRFPFGLNTIASTLTHIMISEWYYVERITGREVPPYAQWPIKYESPPEFPVVDAAWPEQAKKTRAALAAERDWARSITWLSFPDEHGRRFHVTATAGDFFTQLVLHEVHHRAQLMAMLREFSTATPAALLEDLDYNALMFERRPAE